ncbi:MAG: hypothetical protein D4R98_02440 [Comamonadaceae bacterium]|nr:MAG: hypothetical protein D4R98_02440 [Comamonadaceae bacterium]
MQFFHGSTRDKADWILKLRKHFLHSKLSWCALFIFCFVWPWNEVANHEQMLKAQCNKSNLNSKAPANCA